MGLFNRPQGHASHVAQHLFEPLESRQLLAGVTILFHGHESGPAPMQAIVNAIVGRNEINSLTTYTITVIDDGFTGFQTTSTQTGGVDRLTSSSGEIFVIVDWSNVSSFTPLRFTDQIADEVVDEILTPANRFWQQLPIHLIGHGRGVSMATEVAQQLGERGIWVDHLSALDASDEGIELDPLPVTYSNIRYAESIFQSNLSPTGIVLAGSYDMQLGILQGGGEPHDQVLDWYRGTINAGQAGGLPDSYYEGAQGPRNEVGYAYSRIAATVARPDEGLAVKDAFRVPVVRTLSGAQVFDNIELTNFLKKRLYQAGDDITVKGRLQDVNDDAVVEIGLDDNANPYDGVETTGLSTNSENLGNRFSVTIDQDGETGGRYVWASISNGTRTRYFYSQNKVRIFGEPLSNVDPPSVIASDNTFYSRVRVVWSDVPGADRYEVWRSTQPSVADAQLIANPTNEANRYDDYSAAPGKLYYYFVRAKINGEYSDFGGPDSGLRRPINSPDNVRASDGRFEDRIRVNWTPVFDANVYFVYRNTVRKQGTAKLLGSVNDATYVDRSVKPGKEYFYWVQAANGQGYSVYSDPNRGFAGVIVETARVAGPDFNITVPIDWDGTAQDTQEDPDIVDDLIEEIDPDVLA